jgi:hypothetical protein
VKRKAVKEIWHGLGMEQPRSKFDTKISRVLSELFFLHGVLQSYYGSVGRTSTFRSSPPCGIGGRT